MVPKRKYYNNKDYFLDEKLRVVKLSENFHKNLLSFKPGPFNGFKKIGGSSIGNALNLDSLHNDFVAFCAISRIALPILDRKYVDAGIILEPQIIKMLENKVSESVKRFPAEKYKYDYFKDKHEIVGGLPDGYIEKYNTVIEIKTSGLKNYDYWKEKGIPLSYQKQAQLYAYLMNASHYAIVASFLEEDDYINPSLVNVNHRKSMLKIFELNKSQALDDLNKVINWYNYYTQLGTSPQYDPIANADLIEWLKCENEQDWINLFNRWVLEDKAKEYD